MRRKNGSHGEAGQDRVRENTPGPINRKLAANTDARILAYAQKPAAERDARIRKLEREWDLERLLALNASSLVLAGMWLGSKVDRRWYTLPAVVATFLFQHAVQGWCPPLPLLRWLGFRSRREIDHEKAALKALRGDFEHYKRVAAWAH